MNQVTLTVDEKTLHVNEGALLIQVLIDNGIDIPYFCYHEALGPDGNCRMCMVEIEGQKRPQIACDTLVKEGMIVRTRTENINKVRQDILELELINHPVDCPICDQAGECKLQDFYMDYGLYDANVRMDQKVQASKRVDLGSSVVLDQERCVLCARCTRFTSDLTKTHELGIIGRGDHACVSTMPGRKLDNPYAMNVIDLCPVGALTSKDFRFNQRVWFLEATPSVCHGCAKGCNVFMDHNKLKYQDDTLYRFRPRRNDAINGFFICDAGRLSYKTLQEKRQLSFTCNAKSCHQESAINRVKALIQDLASVTIVVDAGLYNEELDAIIAFAQNLGASLYCPSACYYNDKFADAWLKNAWCTANIAGVRARNISESTPDPKELLISFNHPDTNTLQATHKIAFATHEGFEADVVLPIAAYSETSGTLTNIDGIDQYCKKVIHPNTPMPSIIELLKALS